MTTEATTDSTTEVRSDNYANALTGLAGPPDKSSYTYFAARPIIPSEMLDRMYEKSALAARIVDRIVNDGTREGFDLKGVDMDFDWGPIKSDLEDLGALQAFSDGWGFSRLHGGALTVVGANDSVKLEKPLDLTKVTEVRSLSTLDSTYIQPDYRYGRGQDVYNPEFYTMYSPTDSQVRRVHNSRVLRWDASRPPPNRLLINNGWPLSVLERCITELSQLGEVMGYSRAIGHDASIQKLKIENFRKQLLGSEQDKKAVMQAFEMIRFLADNLHIMVLDSNDDYEVQARELGALEKLIDKFVDALVRATDMPRTILLGEQPGGLNANADSEIRSWYDYVHSQQKRVLTPRINRLLTIMLAAYHNRTGSAVPTEWEVEYKALWQPKPQEKADTLLKTMQAIQIGLSTAVLSVSEARSMLASSGYLPESEGAQEEAGEEEVTPEEQPLEAEETGEETVAVDAPVTPSTDPRPADLTSVQEAASAVGVPTRTLTLMMERGQLRYWGFGKRRQVSMSEVYAAGEQARTQPPTVDRSDDQDEIDRVYKRYHELVNMGAEEHLAWSKTEWSKMAGVSREPIQRNQRILRTPKAKWTMATVRAANKTIAYISRAMKQPKGEPVRKGAPYSKGEIALRNWARNPDKAGKADAELPKGGIFARLPPNLARQFSYKPEEPSPPHVTLLHLGGMTEDEYEAAREVMAKLALSALPLEFTLGELGYFERPGGRVAYVSVDVPESVLELRTEARAQLADKGVQVAPDTREWTPHATLAYLTGEEEYEGTVPEGSWTVDRLETWRGDLR